MATASVQGSGWPLLERLVVQLSVLLSNTCQVKLLDMKMKKMMMKMKKMSCLCCCQTPVGELHMHAMDNSCVWQLAMSMYYITC